jgi:hypothetical protein
MDGQNYLANIWLKPALGCGKNTMSTNFIQLIDKCYMGQREGMENSRDKNAFNHALPAQPFPLIVDLRLSQSLP